ncbi:MAG: efflux RND transporter periplasmic adaptor subunit [Chloroflexi bacterium]|nr:efflux RND transporter periplasmic adaptor subunit [Chloroflexota bacterium]
MQTAATNKPANNKKRWLIIGVVGLLLLAGVFLATRVQSARNAQQTAAAAQTDNIATVFSGDLSASATASGQIEAVHTTRLSAATPGLVEDVFVRAGDQVTAGGVLALLDSEALSLQVERAQQNLALQETSLEALLEGSSAEDIAAAEAAVHSAQVRLDNLLAGPTEQEIAESEANIRAQEANVASAVANYNSTLDSISQSTIAAAEAEVVNARIAYNNAKEVNDDDADEATNDVLLDAAEQLAIAETKLADLQAGPNQGNLTSASANISAAQANLEQTEANHDKLLTGSTASQIAAAEATLAQMKANLDSLQEGASAEDIAIAEAGIEQARLALADAEESLADATIRAPFAGTVTAVNINQGEMASNNLIEIVSAELQVILNVDEIDVGVLAPGQEAIITLETWPDEEINGEISSIAPSANNGGGVVTYDVLLTLNETSLPILVGMTANASLITANNHNILLVPNAVLTADRENGIYTVNKISGEQDGRPLIEEVEVTIGLKDNQYTQIISGLSEGDEVVVGQLAPPPTGFGGPFGRGNDN